VKAANVMLDTKFNARLGDFGLARSYNHSLLIPKSTNVAGTFGYFAPEFFHTGDSSYPFILAFVCHNAKKLLEHTIEEMKLSLASLILFKGILSLTVYRMIYNYNLKFVSLEVYLMVRISSSNYLLFSIPSGTIFL